MRRLVIFFAFLLVPSVLYAQNASVGATYTLLSLTYPDQIPNGFGGWLTWDRSASGPTLGVDLGVNFFPEDHPIIGRQVQFLAGVRGGLRFDGFGVFGRFRPGVMHFSERFFAPEIVCIAIFPPPESCLIRRNNAVLDVGATVEIYPTPRSILRIDGGDSLLRFSRTGQDAVWEHNFQFAAGAGIRF